MAIIGAGSNTPPNRSLIIPVANQSFWVVACSAASTADNSGNTVLNPAGITRAAQNWVRIGSTGTTLQICLRYTPSATQVTAPVVQVFGRDRTAKEIADGATAVYQRLVDSAGAHELTLGIDATNDVTDGTYAYSDWAEVDINCNAEVLVAVKTAQDLSNDTIDDILVRVK